MSLLKQNTSSNGLASLRLMTSNPGWWVRPQPDSGPHAQPSEGGAHCVPYPPPTTTIGIWGAARVLRGPGQCRQYYFNQILPTSFCNLQMKLIRGDKALGDTQCLSGKRLLPILPSTSVQPQSQTCPAQTGEPRSPFREIIPLHLVRIPEEAQGALHSIVHSMHILFIKRCITKKYY